MTKRTPLAEIYQPAVYQPAPLTEIYRPAPLPENDMVSFDVFLDNTEFFCSNGIPLGIDKATEQDRTAYLDSLLDGKCLVYSGDFHILRRHLRRYFNYPEDLELSVAQFMKDIQWLNVMKRSNAHAKQIIQFKEDLGPRIAEGFTAMVPMVIKMLLEHRDFITAPFENETTKSALIAFTRSTPEINNRYRRLNQELKDFFEEDVLLAYHNAITGKMNYNPPDGNAPTTGRRGLLDHDTVELHMVLTQNPELTTFIYDQQGKIIRLSNEFYQFKLKKSPEKAINFLKDTRMLNILKKICQQEWIDGINNDQNKIVNKSLIEGCVHLNRKIRNSKLLKIIAAAQSDEELLPQLTQHFTANPKDAYFIVSQSRMIRDLGNQYRAQKIVLHQRPKINTPTDQARKEVVGQSPYKPSPNRKEQAEQMRQPGKMGQRPLLFHLQIGTEQGSGLSSINGKRDSGHPLLITTLQS